MSSTRDPREPREGERRGDPRPRRGRPIPDPRGRPTHQFKRDYTDARERRLQSGDWNSTSKPLMREDRNEEKVDREKKCPFLIRVFPHLDSHNPVSTYANQNVPKGEVQFYTWKDETLRGLSDLVKESREEARKPDSRLSFALVFPDKRGDMMLKIVGTVHSNLKGEDDNKTLQKLDFATGDYLDVAILTGSSSTTSGTQDEKRN